MRKKIVITGGTGRFGEILKKHKKDNLILFPNKKELDILDYKKIISYLEKKKTKSLNSFSRAIKTNGRTR